MTTNDNGRVLSRHIREIIRSALEKGASLVLTTQATDLLTQAMGNPEKAVNWLCELATAQQKPIGVARTIGDGRTETTFLAPANWTIERLEGYIAGFREEFEDKFGEIESVEER